MTTVNRYPLSESALDGQVLAGPAWPDPAPAGPVLTSQAALRVHGTLDQIIDTERRALRPIGTTAHEVAACTGSLLTGLLTRPGVQIFRGVRSSAAGGPRIAHAVSLGHRLMLIESVAWPPGCYTAMDGDQIHCDGVYIGQSVRPLIAAVQHWRGLLPAGHEVSGLVVVHPGAGGELTLPPGAGGDLIWVRAENAVRVIRSQLPRRRPPVSVKAVAALLAAAAVDQSTAGAEEIR